MKAFVTDIQRFSLSDGDGIRTTVFLKGCNMKCTWCHNPETLARTTELMFYRARCIGCGKCAEACPSGAHSIADGEHIIDRALCTNCGRCAEVCYAEALVMCGTEMSVEEVMAEVIQDKAYYDNSNGGVTISGGEVLCNLEFATELARACRLAGINVAIETNLSFPLDMIKPLISELDAVMFDIKLFDEDEHKKYTGIPNRTTLKNVYEIDKLGIPLTVRTPLIPGVTDTVANISKIAEYIKDMKNLVRYELLNFNPLGEGKYRGLDKANKHESARPLGPEKLDSLKATAEAHGIRVKVI